VEISDEAVVGDRQVLTPTGQLWTGRR
jgi:hypothetical protein